jgi:riboflavin synthase
LYVARTQEGRELMQLETAYVVEITKLMEYVDRKEDPLIQIVRTHHHNINSAVLQTARRLKRELGRGTRQRTAQQRTGEGKKEALTVPT